MNGFQCLSSLHRFILLETMKMILINHSAGILSKINQITALPGWYVQIPKLSLWCTFMAFLGENHQYRHQTWEHKLNLWLNGIMCFIPLIQVSHWKIILKLPAIRFTLEYNLLDKIGEWYFSIVLYSWVLESQITSLWSIHNLVLKGGDQPFKGVSHHREGNGGVSKRSLKMYWSHKTRLSCILT